MLRIPWESHPANLFATATHVQPNALRRARDLARGRLQAAWVWRAARALGLGLGAVLLGYCVLTLLAAARYQSEARVELRRLQSETPASTASTPVLKPAPGSILAELEVPRIGLSVMVLEGTDEHTLLLGAGHLPDTRLPGESGNIVIAAHRDTFFRSLRTIKVGDVINLTSPRGTYQYQVDETRIVASTDTEPIRPSDHSVLTLVTCYPFSYIGSAPDRFVVRAHRLE